LRDGGGELWVTAGPGAWYSGTVPAVVAGAVPAAWYHRHGGWGYLK
ncbi:MAG TPA: DUF1905 domain-containing protein, partial [Cyanobacteria bacterium UBA8156]|nr:DUF1905 domain-containing protein [Cyanobacteria bacterium UBA8156]